jgi:ribonuclease III
LQEIAQERERITPTYKTLDTLGPEHERRFTVAVMLDDRVLATGTGKSKQIAEQAAAEAGLATYIAYDRAMAAPDDEEEEHRGGR